MDTTEKVKSRWTRSFFTGLNTRNEEERDICDICNKDFASPSSLTLHRSTHVIERRYKCEPCQVSFHSQGHLQKHRRSSAHETRVKMTQAFGIPTSDNPRPYGCPECNTAFRKHGHLAKHLRSKSHITKLEANELIPVGTYAALEKYGQELKDRLVTTNCEQSLLGLREIAMQLFQHQTAICTAEPSADNAPMMGSAGGMRAEPPPQPAPFSEEQAAQMAIMPPVNSPHRFQAPAQPQSLDYTLQMGTGVPHTQAALVSPMGMIDHQQHGLVGAGPQLHHHHDQQQQQQQQLLNHHQNHATVSPSHLGRSFKMDFSPQIYRPSAVAGNFVCTSAQISPHHSVVRGSHSPSTNSIIVSSSSPSSSSSPPAPLPVKTVHQASLLAAQSSLDVSQQVPGATYLPAHSQPQSLNTRQPQPQQHQFHHPNHLQSQSPASYVNAPMPASPMGASSLSAYHQAANNNLQCQQSLLAFKLSSLGPFNGHQAASMQQPDTL